MFWVPFSSHATLTYFLKNQQGFRTSQTTGLAAHVAAPFVPTVEREAMDLQDAALRLFNTELLQMAGILLRLTLDHALVALLLQI